jgi:hypothetical protein
MMPGTTRATYIVGLNGIGFRIIFSMTLILIPILFEPLSNPFTRGQDSLPKNTSQVMVEFIHCILLKITGPKFECMIKLMRRTTGHWKDVTRLLKVLRH